MTEERDAAAIVRQLEEDIVLGRIHPRERLPEDTLMQRFGAKRHVIRRALHELAVIGVLEHVPNKGAQVRAFTEAEVRDLYDLRELLETTAASLISLPLAANDLARLYAVQRLSLIHI